MSSFFARTAVLAAFVLAGCGSSSSDSGCTTGICAFIPTNGEVSGWTRSGSLRVLTDAQAMQGEAQGGLDGATNPFHAAGLVQVALQKFANSAASEEIDDLRIWQMTDTTTANSVYASLLSINPYSGYSWSDVSVGTEGRIADNGIYIWLNAHKGAYHVEAINKPTAGVSQAARDRLVAFVQAVMAKIP